MPSRRMCRGSAVQRSGKRNYPEEMTRRQQHRFADLIVKRSASTWKLTSTASERIVVRRAIKVFFDRGEPTASSSTRTTPRAAAATPDLKGQRGAPRADGGRRATKEGGRAEENARDSRRPAVEKNAESPSVGQGARPRFRSPGHRTRPANGPKVARSRRLPQERTLSSRH